MSGSSKFTLTDNARIAYRLIDALALKGVWVVGHSYGGSIGLELATQNDERIMGYVLLGPLAYEYNGVNPVYYLITAPGIGPFFAKLLAPLMAKSIIRKKLQDAFAGDAIRIPAGFVEYRAKLWSTPQASMAKAAEMMRFNADLTALTPRLHLIQKPVTLVQGQLDQPRIVDAAHKLSKDLQRVRLMELSNVGHYPQIERPDLVYAAIKELETR